MILSKAVGDVSCLTLPAARSERAEVNSKSAPEWTRGTRSVRAAAPSAHSVERRSETIVLARWGGRHGTAQGRDGVVHEWK
eukprot:6410012-Alexandrium_andersonii.AAC.1